MSLKFLKYQNVLYFLKLLKKSENIKTKEREKQIKGIKNFVAVLYKSPAALYCDRNLLKSTVFFLTIGCPKLSTFKKIVGVFNEDLAERET